MRPSNVRNAIFAVSYSLVAFLCCIPSNAQTHDTAHPVAITVIHEAFGAMQVPALTIDVQRNISYPPAERTKQERAVSEFLQTASSDFCTRPGFILVNGKPLLSKDRIEYGQDFGGKPKDCKSAFAAGDVPTFRIVLDSRRSFSSPKLQITLAFPEPLLSNEFDLTSLPNPSPITLSATTVLNENLIDKTVFKKSVEQFGASATIPFAPWDDDRSSLFVDTKNLFSTNERDAKSAIEGGFGIQRQMSTQYYLPLKFEGQVVGNQVATSLSSVLLVDGKTDVIPRFLCCSKSYDLWFTQPTNPLLDLSLLYTHRVKQIVAAGSKPLPTDDFAVNPSLAYTGGEILHFLCKPKPAGAVNHNVCLNAEGDLGLYYLPLEKTTKGSQRAEGYWDASFLIPLADFSNIPFTTLDAQTGKTQLRIKYEDSVNPATNYSRTKKWSFGIELIK